MERTGLLSIRAFSPTFSYILFYFSWAGQLGSLNFASLNKSRHSNDYLRTFARVKWAKIGKIPDTDIIPGTKQGLWGAFHLPLLFFPPGRWRFRGACPEGHYSPSSIKKFSLKDPRPPSSESIEVTYGRNWPLAVFIHLFIKLYLSTCSQMPDLNCGGDEKHWECPLEKGVIPPSTSFFLPVLQTF